MNAMMQNCQFFKIVQSALNFVKIVRVRQGVFTISIVKGLDPNRLKILQGTFHSRALGSHPGTVVLHYGIISLSSGFEM